VKLWDLGKGSDKLGDGGVVKFCICLTCMRFDWKEKNLLRHSLSTFFKQRFFSDLFSLHESNCVTVGRQAPKSRDSSTPGLGSEVLVPMSVAPFIK
jgi:hypothetical protein